jgi:hypothetical protein
MEIIEGVKEVMEDYSRIVTVSEVNADGNAVGSYQVYAWDDIKEEHKSACALLDAARSNESKHPYSVHLPGVGSAYYFRMRGPSYVLYVER